jgi:uncharacterized membrane protein
MTGWIERRIVQLLRGGMVAAVFVMCVGATWFLMAHGADTADHSHFQASPTGFGEGRALMQLGILILVATPVVRVAFSVGAFARTRDRAYAAITGAVFCILLYSFLGGR